MVEVAEIFVRLGPEHVAEVAAVERDSFALSWSTDDLRALLEDEGVICIGLFIKSALVAYGLGYVQREHFHLASMAVAPAFRRRGIGESLLRRMLQEVEGRGCTRCTLEVRVGNRAARKLYDRAGFRPVRQMGDYYDNPKEDGLELALVIG